MSTLTEQFSSRLEHFLSEKQLLAPGSHVVLAVSGGIDSMTMLHAFADLRPHRNLTLTVAHVNHQLRGEESDGDEAFVRHAAELLGLPFFSPRVATMGYAHEKAIGKQEAARELRYEFFERIRQQVQADAVATAHNADDNAETVLMNALRGSGVHGLAGIPLQRDQGSLIRPMLFAYRTEIEQYAHEAGVEFREDSSNASQDYTRNKIRHSVIPSLEANVGANVAQSLNRISDIMREVGQRLSTETGAIFQKVVRQDGERVEVDIPLLLRQSPLVQDEIILSVLRRLHVEPQAEKVFAIFDLCSSQTGRSLSLSGSVSVYRDRSHLNFGEPLQQHEFTLPVELGRLYMYGNFEFAAERQSSLPTELRGNGSVEFVDSERLNGPLVLRNWHAGDWFIPLGLHNRKKLSDFFIDAKVPRHQKHDIPVLVSGGDIVWVCGYRLDERFMVSPKTASVVKLQYTPHSNVYPMRNA
ncbi:MAG: tRNA lysidine(34) synthetase TilS [Ignavibacteriae bacterium]|nr:tRNA lysidine(34) synthetase TilS [Ignavibacteriota bacterium]